MELFKLLRRESPSSWRSLISLAIISGLSGGLLLAIINAGVQASTAHIANFRNVVLFGIAIWIFMVSKRMTMWQSTFLVETIIAQIRLKISERIRKADIKALDHLGRGEIYTRVNKDTNYISQTAGFLTHACQSGIMVGFSMVYIGWLSIPGLIVTLIAVGCGIYVYLSNQGVIQRQLRIAFLKETEFFESLDHILDGFKEIRVNQKKSDDLFALHTRIQHTARDIKIKVGGQFAVNFLISQFFLYLLVAVIVFFLPMAQPLFSGKVIQLTASILFIIGPLETLIGAFPILANANIAAEHLLDLENALKNAEDQAEKNPDGSVIPFENNLCYEGLVFKYEDERKRTLFTLGPLNLTVKKGEIFFIVGGNGSGKSTFLRLATGLYYPLTGEIRVDNQLVDMSNYGSYRELFSLVFNDFHLFDRLYGLEDIDEKKVNELLRLMQLDEKTEFRNGRFTNTKLSTGHSKRLALIVALLEDRPVYIFDELAADQDPEYRRYFYEVLLQELKDQGKTVIAVTHDDRYFHVADRVYKMDFGKIVEAELI